MSEGFCKHSDRDEPRLTCGYPLPCPHHTVILEDGLVDLPANVVLTSEQYHRLKELSDAVSNSQKLNPESPTKEGE